ncbi:exosortase A [Novosphingobium sp.]|uniref:exosortase A n=1 Tax=Novosphingobium sp. TaxID=1874826 RepID=UPI0035B10D9F
MPPDLALEAPIHDAESAAPWRDALIRLGGCWLALLLLFARDWAEILDQWWNSSTYNHELLVPPIVGWLVWLRLPQLRKLEPEAWWPGLLALGAALVLWMLGAMAGFNLFRQAGAIAMLPASVLLVLGPRVGAGLIFPLCYAAFMVPFGEELVPPLQMITAHLTIWLVQLSNVPANIDGVFIDTPAGLFLVAEACSGVKFLIAMVALGALVGNVCFRSWKRRIAFMALCVVAPIVTNGIRAWGTIYVAQYVGAERAGGIDHIIYGWIFFALVIAAVLGLSWRYFDRAVDDPIIDADAIGADPRLARLASKRIGTLAAVVALGVMVLGTQGWARAADRLIAAVPPQIYLPDVPGWHRVDYTPSAPWHPRASGADHRLLGSYADADGNRVDVFYALYSSQDEGKEAGGFGEGALQAYTEWNWAGPGPELGNAKSERLRWGGAVERFACTWYRSGNLLSGSNARLKLVNIADRVLLRERPTMMLIISAEQRQGHPAGAAIATFASSVGNLGAWMDQIGKVR